MWKRQFLTFLIITWMIVIALYSQSGKGQSAGRNNRRRRPANSRRRVQGMNDYLHRAYLQAVNQPTTTTTATTTAIDLSVFGRTPRLPQPHETECFVEIKVTQRNPGTCIRPGGVMLRPFMCQSGMHMRFDPACQQIIENRNILQQLDLANK